MAWPKGKPRRPVPPRDDGAVSAGELPAPEGVLSPAPSAGFDAPQPPPMAHDGSGDVLMRLPDGRVTEVSAASVPIAEGWGWTRHVA